jgi:hypothetical protein
MSTCDIHSSHLRRFHPRRRPFRRISADRCSHRRRAGYARPLCTARRYFRLLAAESIRPIPRSGRSRSRRPGSVLPASSKGMPIECGGHDIARPFEVRKREASRSSLVRGALQSQKILRESKPESGATLLAFALAPKHLCLPLRANQRI